MKAMDTKAERKKASERATKRQKRMERWETRRFLESLGYRVTALRSGEKPDTIAYVSKNGVKQKIGIEHTGYYVDATPKAGSIAMDLYNLWTLIEKGIRRRVSHLPELKHTTGLVRFKKKGSRPCSSHASQIANELVSLALDCPVAPNEERVISCFPNRYPSLSTYLSEVTLHGTGAVTVNVWPWDCMNARGSCVGLDAGKVAAIINKKNAKSAKYTWGNVDERWLLIAAPGYPAVKSAGPDPQYMGWKSAELKAACRAAGFDRIFFWENGLWCKEIHPGAPIVEKEQRR